MAFDDDNAVELLALGLMHIHQDAAAWIALR
jgi:hypothetical protein